MQKKQRYDKVLDAFGRMLKKRGFDEITMQQLAAASCLSVGTLYNYFKDKDDLVMAYVRESLKPFFDKAEKIASDPPSDVREALSALLESYLEAFISLPKALVTKAIQLSLASELSARPSGSLHQHVTEHIIELIETLRKRGLVSTGVNTEASTLVLFGIITDLVYQYSLRPQVELRELRSRLASCLEVICNGLDSHAGAPGSSGAIR